MVRLVQGNPWEESGETLNQRCVGFVWGAQLGE